LKHGCEAVSAAGCGDFPGAGGCRATTAWMCEIAAVRRESLIFHYIRFFRKLQDNRGAWEAL
jgi:hypothetical protein